MSSLLRIRRFLKRREKSASRLDLSTAPINGAPAPKPIFPSGIKQLHNPDGADLDIVFVHGLQGDRERTWSAPGAPQSWPEALLPSQLPTARILTFGYDAYVTDWRGVISENRVGNHAWNLLTALATFRLDNGSGRPIIFVCHSLGGLVCEDALVTSRQRMGCHLGDIIRSTRGILFLGTPHRGAGLAKWAELLSKSLGLVKKTNPKILQVLRHDSDVLARIQQSFHTMLLTRSSDNLPPIEITCFYEELPVIGVGLIVPQGSAILPGYVPIGIRGNHMDMARFSSIEDPGFAAICGELKRCSKGIAQPRTVKQEGCNTDGIRFLVPYNANPDFVSRIRILQGIEQQLRPGQLDPKRRPRLSLYGLGGTGKTQVALSYVHQLRQTHAGLSIFWVHASSRDRVRQSFMWIAQHIRIPGYDDHKTNILALVKTWLENAEHGPWLMVLDSADDLDLFYGQQDALSSYIPEVAHGSILITSRDKKTGSRLAKGHAPIEVECMDESEAAQLLRSKLGVEARDDEVSALSLRLECLPLALVQAAAFIQENTITVGRYLELLDGSDQVQMELLSKDFDTAGRDADSPQAVTSTWMISFDKIRQQHTLSGELLSLIAFFDCQAIPVEFLSSYYERQHQDGGLLRFDEALGVLKAFSFIMERADGCLNVHRLVQLVARNWVFLEKTASWFVGQALLVVSQAYPHYAAYEDWAVCSRYLPHADVVLAHKDTQSKDEMVARASLLHRTGTYLSIQGRWGDAEGRQWRAADLRKKVLGGDHQNTIASLGNLALTYKGQRRWGEAESLLTLVVSKARLVFGDDHPETLRAMSNLASTYSNLGRWVEAESLSALVVEKYKMVLGAEDPSTIMSMDVLAVTYMGQGQWEKAESVLALVIEKSKRVLGDEHPDTLNTIENLASTYKQQDRRAEAQSLLAYVTEIRKKREMVPGELIAMSQEYLE